MTTLQPLPENLEPTRATLHVYAHAVAAIPRAHAIEHPRWWHISLNVTSAGLVTDEMSLPTGGVFSIRIDLRDHDIVVDTSRGEVARMDMQAGTTAKQMGADIIEAVEALGLTGVYDTSRFDDNDDPRAYEPATAEAFFAVLADAHQALQTHRATLDGEVGPIQLWPHGFDVAFEWFGTRTVEYEEGGETEAHRAQLNLGFYPAGDAYFYSNPWPFESERLLGVDLPYGAEWHTEGWEGSMLKYDAVAGRPDATDRVTTYAAAVYAAAAPTLLA